MWASGQGLALERLRAGLCKRWASLMKEVGVGAVIPIGRI